MSSCRYICLYFFLCYSFDSAWSEDDGVTLDDVVSRVKQWEETNPERVVHYSSSEPVFVVTHYFQKKSKHPKIFVKDRTSPAYLHFRAADYVVCPDASGGNFAYFPATARAVRLKGDLEAVNNKLVYGAESSRLNALAGLSNRVKVSKKGGTYLINFELDYRKLKKEGAQNYTRIPSWPYNSQQFNISLKYFINRTGRPEQVVLKAGPFSRMLNIESIDKGVNPFEDFSEFNVEKLFDSRVGFDQAIIEAAGVTSLLEGENRK